MKEKELPYALWLNQIKGLGSRTICRLLQKKKSPEALYAMKLSEWESLLPQGKQKIVQTIEQARIQYEPKRLYENLQQQEIFFTCLGHEKYPYLLSKIQDCPFGLYYKGRMPEPKRLSVAVIGARNCSPYGKYMAEKFGSELAQAGVQVISGMARGVDGISQLAALHAGGYSLAVLGCGVDICYPHENKELYDTLLQKGGICSEYAPGTLPQSYLFPQRNRLISGMSDGTLVVEAKQKSGTLITVDMALEQGREVFAVPGRVTEPLSEGCNQLLKQGACMVRNTPDILQELRKDSLDERQARVSVESADKKTAQSKATQDKNWQAEASQDTVCQAINAQSNLEQLILSQLDLTPKSVEEIQRALFLAKGEKYSACELQRALMQMELQQKVQRIGGGSFVR